MLLLRRLTIMALPFDLDLYGGVRNTKFCMQIVRHMVKKRIARMTVRHYQMRRECDVGGAGTPDVQIVYAAHARASAEPGFDGRQVYAVGYAVECQVQGLAKQTEGADDDDDANHDTGQRVEPSPASP